jgi:flagellar biosynthesis protein FliQ
VLLAGPLLMSALAVGLLIGIFQAATQIQEMTLSFIPKLLALVIALFVAGPWMIQVFVTFRGACSSTFPPCSADGYGPFARRIIALLQTYLWPFLRVSAHAAGGADLQRREFLHRARPACCWR